MNQMKFIRTKVFGATQVEMATIADVSQATVSRWESGKRDPSRTELGRIRREATARGIRWNDAWFFGEVAA